MGKDSGWQNNFWDEKSNKYFFILCSCRICSGWICAALAAARCSVDNRNRRHHPLNALNVTVITIHWKSWEWSVCHICSSHSCRRRSLFLPFVKWIFAIVEDRGICIICTAYCCIRNEYDMEWAFENMYDRIFIAHTINERFNSNEMII